MSIIQSQLHSMIADKSSTKPPLKWAGGKRWLLPELQMVWQKHVDRRLVEPFCGGLAVSLGLMPKRALLNDINMHVINFYRWLQNGLRIKSPMYNDAEHYYRCRASFNELINGQNKNSIEAAELFYYLNRTGYNGLCRFNKNGQFNVPFGSYKKINYTSDFAEYAEIMRSWQFESGDFELLEVQPEDLIYADPPYDVQFRQYSKEGFAWKDQIRLAEWLIKHPGPVILSNQATDRIVALYTRMGFRLQLIDAPRRISCTGDRSTTKEVLATKGI